MEALLYTSAFSDFGDITKVHKELVSLGINLGTCVDDRIELSKLESKYLGLSITNIHPLQQIAAAYTPIIHVEDGDRADVACYILNLKSKVTKNNKPYVMFVCQCLNSQTVFNLFDWNNNSVGLKKGDFQILHIIKQNGFIRLNMNSSFNQTKKGFYQKFGGR
jgi:hypothetical protein